MKTTAWITPAGAGKTLLFFGGQCVVRDHPRRCGENVYLQANWLHCRGSPPQVRGKRDIQAECADGRGITPAGAGKTIAVNSLRSQVRDHPRRCGENLVFCHGRLCAAGSPPQVRGKPVIIDELQLSDGITPAGAGKTTDYCSCNNIHKDHPRRCGENHTMRDVLHRESGSPPQVRGKPLDRTEIGKISRITPAGAGKTCCSSSNQTPLQDHPRRCGENFAGCVNRLNCFGITPAGAGKTSWDSSDLIPV